MKSTSLSEFVKRLVILFIGLTIAHLGVTFFLLSNLGSDPFNVLIQGIANLLPLTHGTCHQIVCFLIVGILLVIARSYIKTGTFICMFFGGPIIDFFTYLLGGIINDSSSMVIRYISLVLGCFILAFGMTIVIKSEAGTGPNDLVGVVLSDKTKKPFGICRVIVDFSFVIIGVILGGVFGIGTIVCAFLIGPIADRFLPISEKLVQKLLKK
jgi:uncharacterized membrane protein YczE